MHTCTHMRAHTHSFTDKVGQSAKQPNLFSLSVSLTVAGASALCFFKVPVYVSSSISLCSLCLSPLISFHTGLAPLPPPFCCFLRLPVYFYISSLVRLICNPTRAASSRLSARQNPLSPALICRPAGCSAAIIRTTVTVAANSLQQEAHIHAAYAVSNTRTCFMCFICSS